MTGLRSRLAVASAVIVGLAVVMVGSIGYVSTARTLRGEVDSSLATFGSRLTGDDGHAARKLCEHAAQGADGGDERDDLLSTLPGASIQCVDPTGAVTAWISPEPAPVDLTDQLPPARGLGVGPPTTVTVHDHPYRFVVVAQPDGSQVRIGRSLAEVDRALESILLRSLVAGGLVIIVAALVGVLIARRLTQPLGVLTDTAEEIARSGRTDVRIALDRKDETDRNDETGRLARSFQTMLAALDESRAAQEQLVQDASHELRTPLTSLRANIGLLRRHPDIDPDTRREVVVAVDAELAELSALVDELVEVSAALPEAEDPIDIRVDLVVIAAVERARSRYARSFDVSVEPMVVTGSARLLERAVRNLLENAVKFSPDDSEVEVRVGDGRLVVRDHGPGFAEGDLPHVFDRFFRAVDARGLPGSGLGLAIVRRAAEASGASVSAMNSADGGAVVRIEWPAGFSQSSQVGLTPS